MCGTSPQVVIGGTNMNAEANRMKSNAPSVLVGTPGRVLDHLTNESSSMGRMVQDLRVLIFDEVWAAVLGAGPQCLGPQGANLGQAAPSATHLPGWSNPCVIPPRAFVLIVTDCWSYPDAPSPLV